MALDFPKGFSAFSHGVGVAIVFVPINPAEDRAEARYVTSTGQGYGRDGRSGALVESAWGKGSETASETVTYVNMVDNYCDI